MFSPAHFRPLCFELLLDRAEPFVGREGFRLGAEKLLVALDHRLGQVTIRLLLLVDFVIAENKTYWCP